MEIRWNQQCPKACDWTHHCSESEGIPKQSSFPRKILEKTSAFQLAIVCTLKKQANPDKSEWITRTHSLNENRYRCHNQILSWSFPDRSSPLLNLSWSVRSFTDPSDPWLILYWSIRSFTEPFLISRILYWSVRDPLLISQILYWPITSFTDPWLIARPFFNRSFFPSLEISLPIEGLRISGTKPRHLFAFAATHFSPPFQASTTELEKWHQGEHLVTQETNKIRYK